MSLIRDLISKTILVYDNSSNNSVEVTDNTTTIYLEGINGSYRARNKALEFVQYGEVVLLIDDDVSISGFKEICLDENVLYVPKIGVDGIPQTSLERWYVRYAFDQSKFVSQEKFAPTITWLFIYNGVSFNDNLQSGGDIEASRFFDRLFLIDDFVINTSLRKNDAILIKFRRQILGLSMRKGRIWLLIYMFKLMLIGTGGNSSSLAEIYLKYYAGYHKARIALGIFLSWNTRLSDSLEANKVEVLNKK